MFAKQALRITLIACFTGLMYVAAGCTGAGIGWLAAMFKGPEKVKAVYQPPKDKKFLVFVDDLAHPLSYEPVKRDLSEKLNKLLVENKVATDVVDYEQLLNLSIADKKFNQLGVWNIGRRLGADIVLFIEVKDFRLKEYEDTELWQGRFEVEVRLVDCNAPKDNPRLWPTDRKPDEGEMIPPVETEAKEESAASHGVEVANELSEKMADRIDKLFHDYEVETKFGE